MNNTKRSYAVVGVGGVGGLYGARLQKAGHDVHFLLRSDYDHVSVHGLRVDSVDGDIILPDVKAYSRPEDMPECDVVLVALKATENGHLEQILPRIVRRNGLVLLMQNGIGGEEQIAEMVPDAEIVGGLCFLCSSKIGPGHIRHIDYGHVHIAGFTGDGAPAGITDAMVKIESDIAGSGVEVKCLDDLVLARWRKLVWNVPFNGLTVVLNTTTDRLMAHPATEGIVRTLMFEVLAGAKSLGRVIDPDFVDLMLDYTRKMEPYKPSMFLDWERRRKMELEAIYGNPLSAALNRGVDLPGIRMVYRMLQFLASSQHS